MTSKPPSKEISPKLQKTIDKLQKRIKENPDYEVHQELKAIANRWVVRVSGLAKHVNRYVRVKDYDSAVQLLYVGGELLLENGLGASGSDIAITLLEVYNAAHLKPDSTNRARIVQLLGMMDISEPNRTRVIHDAIE